MTFSKEIRRRTELTRIIGVWMRISKMREFKGCFRVVGLISQMVFKTKGEETNTCTRLTSWPLKKMINSVVTGWAKKKWLFNVNNMHRFKGWISSNRNKITHPQPREINRPQIAGKKKLDRDFRQQWHADKPAGLGTFENSLYPNTR